MPTLAREFGAFLKLYAELREVAEVLENHGHHKKRRARAGESRANELSHGPARHRGSAPDGKDRDQERRELVSRMKSGKAEDGDLIRYMELTDEALTSPRRHHRERP